MISIRPPYWQLASGRLDHQLRAWFRTCKPHTEVTAWHEASNNPLRYPAAIHNPAHYRAMLLRLQRLARGTNVSVGPVICGPMHWAMITHYLPAHMSFYGLDIYARRWLRSGHLNLAALDKRLLANWLAARRASGERHPHVELWETNASPNFRRFAWFTDIAGWRAPDGTPFGRIATFWRKNRSATEGGLSGPWPPSPGVVKLLRQITWRYQ